MRKHLKNTNTSQHYNNVELAIEIAQRLSKTGETELIRRQAKSLFTVLIQEKYNKIR